MPKTTKKKPTGKAVAAALKAMENMVFETTDPDVQLKQMRERLNAAGIAAGGLGGVDLGYIYFAGRHLPSGEGEVEVVIGSPPIGYVSDWPEWAYEVAKDALLFNKQVLVVYSDPGPFGPQLQMVFCMNRPV
jgi:hypothetical protein